MGFLLIGLNLVASLIVAAFLIFKKRAFSISPSLSEGLAIVWTFVSATLVMRWLKRDTDRPTPRADLRRSLLITSCSSLLMIAFSFTVAWALKKLHYGSDPATVALTKVHGSDLVALFISICILSPVTEEIAIRGILYNLISRGTGTTWGALISSIFFATYHLNVAMFLPLFCVSLAITWLYQRTGRLSSACAAHISVNTATVLWILLGTG
jgi:membrane protease YdiL (CAAX protease family)